MRRSFWGVLLISTSLITSVYSSENLLSVFENAHTNTNLTEHLQNGLTELGINFDSKIPENRLAAYSSARTIVNVEYPVAKKIATLRIEVLNDCKN